MPAMPVKLSQPDNMALPEDGITEGGLIAHGPHELMQDRLAEADPWYGPPAPVSLGKTRERAGFLAA